MASPIAEQMIAQLFARQQGGTPGQAIAAGLSGLGQAYVARAMQKREQDQKGQNAAVQKQIADALMGNVPGVQTPADGVGPTRLPQPNPQQAIALALQNPKAVEGNQLLQAILSQQIGPERRDIRNVGSRLVDLTGGTPREIYSAEEDKPQDLVTVEFLDKSRRSFRRGDKGLDAAIANGAVEVKAPVVQIDQNGNARILSDKEAKDKGFRPGTVVQESGGKLNVVQQPPAEPQVPAETRAKLGMLDASQKSLVEAQSVLFPSSGGYRKGLLTALYSPVRTGAASQFYNSMRDAVSNRLRAESGATITDQDIDDALDRFLPKPWDSEQEAKNRFTRFNQFVSSYRSAIANVPQESQQPTSNTVRFEDLPDG